MGGIGCYVSVICLNGLSGWNAGVGKSINEDNQAPIITNLPGSYNAALGLQNYFSVHGSDADIPADVITYSLDGDTCSFTVNVASNGLVSWTCGEPETCTADITLSDDGTPAPVLSDTKTLTINCVADVPTIITTPSDATESTAYSYNITCVDPESAPLTLSLSPGDTCGGTVTDNGDGTGTYDTWTPNETQGGTKCIVGVLCSDGTFSSTDDTMINIIEDNQGGPTLSLAAAPATTPEADDINFLLTCTDPDTPFDPQYSIAAADTCDGDIYYDSNTGETKYSGHADETQGGGTCTIAVSCGDGTYSDTKQAIVNVLEINKQPYWVWENEPADIFVNKNEVYNQVNGQGKDNDIPAQTISCTNAGDDCSFAVTVTGSGGNPQDCTISFTAPAALEYCSLDVNLSDGTLSRTKTILIANSDPILWHVDLNAPGGGDGLSWATAFQHPQTAVDAAISGDQVWVASGDYYQPVVGTGPVLTMKDGVDLYGGFKGDESVFPAFRTEPFWNMETDGTVLLGGRNCFHVVVGASNARLDGFAITDGNAMGGGQDDMGGGIYNNGVTNLVVENCNIGGNDAYSDGGGIYNYASSVTFTNVTVDANNADRGAGIADNNSSVTISNSYVTNNKATYDGGGIFDTASSSTILNNSLLYYNYAYGDAGGAIYSTGSTLTGGNNTIYSNTADRGGAISHSTSTVSISNSIFWGNLMMIIDPEINGSGATITYSDVAGGYTGAGNIDADPLFVQSDMGTFSQIAAGEGVDSPCLNAGGDTAMNLGLDTRTTRSDGVYDAGQVDMGYHTLWELSSSTVSTPDLGQVFEDTPLNVFFTCIDPNGLPTTFSLVSALTCGGTFVDHGDGTADYDLVPDETMGGLRCNIKFICTNGITQSYAGGSFTLLEDNKAPVITNLPGSEDASTEHTNYFPVQVTDPDIPANVLSYGTSGNNCSFGVAVDSYGTASWTCPVAEETCSVDITVTDVAIPRYPAMNDTETLTINCLNDVPTLTSTPPAADENIAYTYNITCQSLIVVPLTLSLSAQDTCGGTVTDNSDGTGTYSNWTPDESEGGSSCLVGVVCDDGFYSDTDDTAVYVNEDNQDGPVLTLNTPASINENEKFSFELVCTDLDTPFDPVYTISAGDTCGGYISTSTGVPIYEATPTESMGGGSCVVGVNCADNGEPSYEAELEYAVPVVEDIRLPYWTPAAGNAFVPSDITISTSSVYNQLNGQATDDDLPAQTLTCSNAGDTCSFPVSVTGSGTSPQDCTIDFTAGAAPETCAVDVNVNDGTGDLYRVIIITVQ